MKKIEFTTEERRALGLGFGKLDGSYKEQKALRKILNHFHWIVRVADCNYDRKVAFHHVMAAGQVMAADLSIVEYNEKRVANEKD